MRIMGELARRGFMPWKEVIATRSLDVLLQRPELSAALLGMIQTAAGVDLGAAGGQVTWNSEQVHKDRARSDLIASVTTGDSEDASDVQLIIIEGKFSATASEAQMAGYRDALEEDRLTAGGNVVLEYLVPDTRVPEARAILERVCVNSPGVHRVVLTWDAVLDALRIAIDHADSPDRDGLHDDLSQLMALAEAATGLGLRSFSEGSFEEILGRRWDDLVILQDLVAVRLNDEASARRSRLYPCGSNHLAGLKRSRYHADEPGSSAVLFGIPEIGGEFAQADALTLFVSQKTPGYQQSMQRLAEANFHMRPHPSGSWIPIQLPRHAVGLELVKQVTDQIQEVDRAMRGAASN